MAERPTTKKPTPKSSGPNPNKRNRSDRDRRVRQADRLARVLRVLELVQSRGRWTTKAIADEIECSERTVYRDLDVLSIRFRQQWLWLSIVLDSARVPELGEHEPADRPDAHVDLNLICSACWDSAPMISASVSFSSVSPPSLSSFPTGHFLQSVLECSSMKRAIVCRSVAGDGIRDVVCPANSPAACSNQFPK